MYELKLQLLAMGFRVFGVFRFFDGRCGADHKHSTNSQIFIEKMNLWFCVLKQHAYLLSV